MTLLHLRYFQVLAREQQLTRAAALLYITPSALSAILSKLEAELRCELFDRVGRNIRLNQNGEILLRHVDQVFTELDIAKTEIDKFNAGGVRPIRVGVTSPPLWLPAFNLFGTENPDIQVQYNSVLLTQIMTPAVQADYDFFIVALNNIDPRGFNYEILYDSESPGIFVSASSSLAKMECADLRDLKDELFVSMYPDTTPGAYFEEMFKLAGFTPHILQYCDYLMQNKLVASGNAIGLMTDLSFKLIVDSEKFRYISLSFPEINRKQAIIWRRNKTLTKDEELFKDFFVYYSHHSDY